MTQVKQQTKVDADKLMAFVFQCVEEVGATLNTGLVVMGHKLGYYRAMATSGPTTPSRLAAETGTSERYAREWLNAQAAGSFVQYDPATGRYTLPPEQITAFTDETSPAYLTGLFQIALGTVANSSKIVELARSGAGFGWDEHGPDVHEGCERFFRPSYDAHLVAEWLPALHGVTDKLEAGARVADIGCGHGASTIIMARAFPHSTFVGYDCHAASIDTARARAQAAGVGNRVRFDVASADSFGGVGFELVTTFDALHDMGDPVGAARQVRHSLAGTGTWMIVEPMAGDHIQDNFHPVGRTYYGFSTLLCVPGSLSQDVGLALGTQAGPARINDVVAEAGFTRFTQVAQTPFHQVLEVQP
jgi:SAM-dependent methyltransferase